MILKPRMILQTKTRWFWNQNRWFWNQEWFWNQKKWFRNQGHLETKNGTAEQSSSGVHFFSLEASNLQHFDVFANPNGLAKANNTDAYK